MRSGATAIAITSAGAGAGGRAAGEKRAAGDRSARHPAGAIMRQFMAAVQSPPTALHLTSRASRR